MEPLQQEDLVFTARLETQYGVLTAPQAPESYNPNFISFFTEFEFSGRPLISDVVTFPERRWNFFDDFLKDKGITLTNGEYRDIRLGKTPFPEGEEYFAQDNPHDWQEREPSGYQGPAFGSIWVPIDGLRYGIEANISFPEFSEEKAE
jgi:hypothetical protein